MMKKLLIIALCAIVPMAGFAQKKAKKGKKTQEEVVAPVVEVLSDEECLMNLSLFHESVKNKQYDEAYGFWLPVYQSRPDLNKAIYTDGAEILNHRYQQATDDAHRNALRDSIMKLHDERIKFFDDPKYPDAYVLGLKGMDYLTYYPEDELGVQAYDCLKQSVEGMGENSQITVLRKLVEVSYNIYKSNVDQYGDQFLADYQKAAALLDAIVVKGGKNASAAQSQKAYVDRLYAASGAADCGQMDQMYASVVAESANDIEKLGSIMKLYRRLGCTESDVYFAAAEHAHKLQPTSESAAGCAQMCIKKEDYAGAVEYYKQALSLVNNDEDKADYLYRMANVYVAMKNYQQGATVAQQALDVNAEDGRCYLLLGICYASAKVSDDPILQRSVFWVACDMFRKAKTVDSSCAADANKLIATYSQYFPSKEDVFFHRDLNEGAPYRVGGWVNKTTTCRSKAE
jgi:tetratricopeptide (TPR) repeat protein